MSSINEPLTEEQENKRNPHYQRFFGLFQKSFWFEFKNQFPVIINFGLACIIMCILTNWFCSLIDLVFRLTDMMTVVRYRQTDIANKCFDYCFGYYPPQDDQEPIDSLAKCFVERPGEAFRKRDTEKYAFNACGSYLTFLGLDF